ncbi:hypothetical protein [Mesoterricola sediminis]|uniref:DUF3052 family protein n=1 Tax=Mesoterricola sediminis TaxID=2927980 RepID=A0AA48KC53_9BACT|nr:hypothetical protein [Mesoterricola sediminis]BDU76804.1 hypothetical protein METESE_17620 [Mesoterricola sediminis]
MDVWAKLNLKGQTRIAVLGAPPSFEPALAALDGVQVEREAVAPLAFALAFAERRSQLDAAARDLAGKAEGDAILWFAYPKRSSRRYACDFDRDHGWEVLREAGWDSVRMVALDEDWSALRFRRKAFIRKAGG